MNPETKTCKKCQNDFTVTPEDFVFYEKMHMPAPTFCYECRSRRRMMWRNERSLYKRKCQAPGHSEDLITIYAPEKYVVVYDQKYWWSDEWDPTDYGQEYDFNRPFFEQFKELFSQVPQLALSNSNAVNSDYCNVADQSKNCYMALGTYKIENLSYVNRAYESKDSVDVYVSFGNELCYECVSCSDSYHLLYSRDSVGCRDSYFLYDCKNCSDCVGCTNLRNAKYCIFNEQYTKEEYEQKKKELGLDSQAGLKKVREQFEELYTKSIHEFARIAKSVDSTGDNIIDTKNSHWCFDLFGGMEDSKYSHWGGLQAKDLYDAGPGVGDGGELMYDVTDTGIQSADIAFTNVVYGSHDVRYSVFCHGSKHLFGCIGVRSQEYCILNKKYSKEEYEELIPKIKQHMMDMPYVDKKGRVYTYGEFFPEETAPMAFNESIAIDYFPLSKKEAEAYGYPWREGEKTAPQITIKNEYIPDTIEGVDDSITKEVLECAHKGACEDNCSVGFRIIPQELEFYRRLKIPLPTMCFSCRHVSRLKHKKPLRLWKRKCQCAGEHSDNGKYQNTTQHQHEGHCPNEFETSYAPDREEIVYCEQCYNAEVV
ncbi:hypothetical protein KC727_02180 [Candidatus Kaiserbacteria bacterium]|nr:hypothetical protein [Candidatus Kaiserbacteria bacterium]